MRILLTSPTFPPANSGLGNAVAQQAANLSCRGHDVVIATGGGGRSSEWVSGLRVERFALEGADVWLHPIKGDQSQYLEFLCDGGWDAVLLHAWQNWATDLVLKYRNKVPGRCYVFSHCISTNVFYFHQPIRSLLRYLAWRPYWWRLHDRMAQLDGVFFLSNSGTDSRFDDLAVAQKCGVARHVIPNCLSSGALTLCTQPELPMVERDRVIAVGSYQWQKGFDFVLRAYAASVARFGLPLHLFGQAHTAFSHDLRRLAKDLGLSSEQVVFHEGVTGDALLDQYRKARLVLSGSHTECQPLVLLDASAAGVPFVARATGCIANMPGGVTIRSYDDMAQEIDGILQNPEVWRLHSNAAKQAAMDVYHPQKVTDLLLSALCAQEC